MSFPRIIAELAKGIAIGLAEQLADSLKAGTASRASPQARVVGQQLANSLFEPSRKSVANRFANTGQLEIELPPTQLAANERQLIDEQRAVWNHRQTPTPELLRAMADYQERIDRGLLE